MLGLRFPLAHGQLRTNLAKQALAEDLAWQGTNSDAEGRKAEEEVDSSSALDLLPLDIGG